MNIRHDFHLHSAFSGDSDTDASLMAERALSLSLGGICFTEHQDIDAPCEEPDFTVDFPAYFERINALRAEYRGRLQIGCGIEFGMQPHLAEALPALTAQWPFDFVIASLHYINGKDPYYPAYFEGRDEQSCYEEFFAAELEMLKRFSDYDTLGHMDYIVRYGPNRNRFYTYETYGDFIDPILRHLITNGKCLEVNTGGYKYGLGEPNPSVSVLRRYRELGGELLTIGSDAHEPQYLGYDFQKTEAMLRELGFRYYTIFEGRRPQQINLE